MPLSLYGKGIVFALAVFLSIVERYGSLIGDMKFYANVLLEEETSNLMLLAMSLLTSYLLQVLIQINLALFALISICIWA